MQEQRLQKPSFSRSVTATHQKGCLDLLWPSIWHALEQFDNSKDLGGWIVKKVKAHMSAEAKSELALSDLQQVWANELADKKARPAAHQDPWMQALRLALQQTTENVTNRQKIDIADFRR